MIHIYWIRIPIQEWIQQISIRITSFLHKQGVEIKDKIKTYYISVCGRIQIQAFVKSFRGPSFMLTKNLYLKIQLFLLKHCTTFPNFRSLQLSWENVHIFKPGNFLNFSLSASHLSSWIRIRTQGHNWVFPFCYYWKDLPTSLPGAAWGCPSQTSPGPPSGSSTPVHTNWFQTHKKPPSSVCGFMVWYMTESHYSLGMVTRTWSTLYLQRQFLIYTILRCTYSGNVWSA